MSILSLLGIAVGLAMDALAVSIAAGMTITPLTNRHVFRLAFHFGLFQFLMPIVGWLAGRQIASWMSAYDHWVAFALLGFVGGRMLWEAFHGDEPEARSDPSRGLTLVTLSVATSIDALAVGVSMALIGVAILKASVVIGVVTGTLSMLGVRFGSRLGQRWGFWAEVCGGCVLLAIGTHLLISHLH